MNIREPITPEKFDAMVSGKPEKVWGAPAIAKAIGVSVGTVYRLAAEGRCPIFQPGGRYFAYRSELEAWLRSVPANERVL